MSDYRNVLEDTNFTSPKWSYEALKELLLQICNDIDNWEGDITYMDMPNYLKDFWNDHKADFWAKGLKSERYAKYLELKREFENT